MLSLPRTASLGESLRQEFPFLKSLEENLPDFPKDISFQKEEVDQVDEHRMFDAIVRHYAPQGWRLGRNNGHYGYMVSDADGAMAHIVISINLYSVLISVFPG